MSVRWIGFGALAASWLVGSACVPDETGYGEDTGDGVAEEEFADPEAEGPAGADDARAFDVYYAPQGVLGASPVAITALALDGSADDGDVSVEVVDGPAASWLTEGALGGVVAEVEASAGQVVVWRQDSVEIGRASLAAGAGSDLGPGDVLTPTLDVDAGVAAVGDGALAIDAPYVVWNEDQARVIRVHAGDVDATLPVASGEVICAAQGAEIDGAPEALQAPRCAQAP